MSRDTLGYGAGMMRMGTTDSDAMLEEEIKAGHRSPVNGCSGKNGTGQEVAGGDS